MTMLFMGEPLVLPALWRDLGEEEAMQLFCCLTLNFGRGTLSC